MYSVLVYLYRVREKLWVSLSSVCEKKKKKKPNQKGKGEFIQPYNYLVSFLMFFFVILIFSILPILFWLFIYVFLYSSSSFLISTRKMSQLSLMYKGYCIIRINVDIHYT